MNKPTSFNRAEREGWAPCAARCGRTGTFQTPPGKIFCGTCIMRAIEGFLATEDDEGDAE